MKQNIAVILIYFLSLILIGSILLVIPPAWAGPGSLSYIDALFTSTSAVCVTGLITVDTALYSLFGKAVILVLIQFGGLGLLSFSTFYLVLFSRKLSLKGRRSITEYYIDSVEYEPVTILRQIVIMTVTIEVLGAVILFSGFIRTMDFGHAAFSAVFHSISAFCNAGFSIYSDGLEAYKSNVVINIGVMLLIILGGIGFVVLRDIGKRIFREKRVLSLHTRIVVSTSAGLIIFAALAIFALEYANSLESEPFGTKILVSLFQAVTPRTAGFNTVPFNGFSLVTLMFFLPLMFIGGAPGSIAGGIKVTTFFVLLQILFKRFDARKRIYAFRRKISAVTIMKGTVFTIKAFALLALLIFLLVLFEYELKPSDEVHLFPVIFEGFSAFGTVGLSLGVTPTLSIPGKIIIVITMMTGRFGLFIIVLRLFSNIDKKRDYFVEDEVLIG